MDEDDYDDRLHDELVAFYYGDKPNKGKNKNMEKKFEVMQPSRLSYKTYEEAEKAAKQYVAKNHNDYVILQAVALANTPTPDVAVTKL